MHQPTGRWVIAGFLALCLLCCDTQLGTMVSAADDTKTVKLIVDYGDGVEKHFSQLKCQDKTTVFDLMQQAAQHRRGIRFEHRGKGATVLLTQIDDVKNQDGPGRNWIYRVNDKLGDRSIGIHELKPGDTVLWKFETYQ